MWAATTVNDHRQFVETVARIIQWGEVRLEEWPPERLTQLASWVADTRPLGCHPGWRYRLLDSSAEPSVLLRKRIWTHFAAFRGEHAILVRWYRGLRIWLYLGNDLSWELFVGGEYDPNEFAFLAAELKPGMTFVDVGANEGLYTIFGARCVGARGRVIAIEPSRRECVRLGRNVAANHLRNVEIVPVAASNGRGEALLRVAGYGHEGHNTLGAFIYDTGLARTETVPLAALDAVVRDSHLGRVDVIKIDVEGGELAVLQGAREILSRDHPILVLELSEAALRTQGARREEVLNLLKEHDYQVFVFDPASGRPVPGETPLEEDPNVVAVRRPARGS
jgi:FkbM family methyltransferase